jgi:hypothetical protein
LHTSSPLSLAVLVFLPCGGGPVLSGSVFV